MFDIGFAELIIIAVVGLLVIGPERLPGTIRTASLWLNRIRRSFNDVKREIQQELHNDSVMQDLKDAGKQIQQDTQALKNDIQGAANTLIDDSSKGDQTETEAQRAGKSVE
ncbi:MAG: Sec-independent protein translocase protein TatB [Pseudomonadota bacterium]